MTGILAGLLSMFAWGVADFLAAKSTRKVGNVLTLFWMQIVGFLVASIYFLINLSSFNIATVPRFFTILMIVGLLQLIANLFFYKGFKEGQVSLVSPIGSSWAMVTVILSVMFLREAPQPIQIMGILLTFIGLILASINIKELFEIKKLTVLAGVREGIIAMIGWGLSFFLIVPASQALDWFLPVYIFRFSTLLFLTLYIFFKKLPLKTSLKPSLAALYLPIGFLSIVAPFSYSFGVGGEYASIVAPIAASSPLITIVLARIFLKEKITLNQASGIAAIITGIILISL